MHTAPSVSAAAGAAPAEPAPAGFSVLGIANTLLRHARAILIITAAVTFFVLLLTILRGSDFVAQSRFRPQGQQSQLSQFSGLAAQFGIDIGGRGGESEPIEYYAELATSPDLLLELARSSFAFEEPGTGDSLAGTLPELLEAEGDTEAERLRNTIELLEYRVSARADPKAGIITLRTTAPWPPLAAQMNRRLLELMNEFNVSRRRSTAAAEREFVERRLAEAQEDLLEAEASLQEFMTRNRRYGDAPELSFEAGRLQRRVDLQSQVYTSLAQSYEQARIVEVRNTPVLTVIDRPETLVKRAGGSIVVNLLLAIMVGGALGIAWALMREYIDRERAENPAEYRELVSRIRPWRLRR